MTKSLADLLFATGMDASDDEVMIIDDTGSVTRAQLTAIAEDVAAALVAADLRAGSPIAVRLDDGWPVVAALFGVWHADCVYVPVNPRLTDDETTRLYADVEPVATLEADGAAVRVKRTEYERAPHDRDVALIQMTSGTTGRPKPVLLRHTGVLDLMDGVLRKIRGKASASAEPRPPMPNLIPVSLSLWAGLYNVLFAFRVGAPAVIMNGFTTTRFADLVARYLIKSTVLPPAAMTMLTDDPAIDDLAPLRFVRSITAPLSPLQARRFHDKFGVSVLNSYGQTELGGEIIGWNAADSRTFGQSKLGAVGRPHEDVRVRVDTESGELQVRTPAIGAGGAGDQGLSDRMTSDGWFRTGDIGRVDDDGFVWLDGRVSDMINRGGLKVFPNEVEEVLLLAPSVADVAVAGLPDERLGEVPVAFIVPKTGAPLDTIALDRLCRDHLAPYKVPVAYEPIATLPRNEVGKVLRRELTTE